MSRLPTGWRFIRARRCRVTIFSFSSGSSSTGRACPASMRARWMPTRHSRPGSPQAQWCSTPLRAIPTVTGWRPATRSPPHSGLETNRAPAPPQHASGRSTAATSAASVTRRPTTGRPSSAPATGRSMSPASAESFPPGRPRHPPRQRTPRQRSSSIPARDSEPGSIPLPSCAWRRWPAERPPIEARGEASSTLAPAPGSWGSPPRSAGRGPSRRWRATAACTRRSATMRR